MALFQPKTRLLFVCTANICRSPLAEALTRHRLREHGLHRRVLVDSAGTHASQPGHRPDVRAQRIAGVAGVRLAGLRARQLTSSDFDRSDFILAMDNSNVRNLVDICPSVHRDKINLLMSFAGKMGVDEVPDPYYGSYLGFEEVFRLIDGAVAGLVAHLENTLY